MPICGHSKISLSKSFFLVSQSLGDCIMPYSRFSLQSPEEKSGGFSLQSGLSYQRIE
jgi:hypothetical protein